MLDTQTPSQYITPVTFQKKCDEQKIEPTDSSPTGAKK